MGQLGEPSLPEDAIATAAESAVAIKDTIEKN
jgi:hypothetical protein